MRIKPHDCGIKTLFAKNYFIMTAGSLDEVISVYHTQSLKPKTQILDFNGDIVSNDVILDKYVLIGLKSGIINVYLMDKKNLAKHKSIKWHSSAVVGITNNNKILIS